MDINEPIDLEKMCKDILRMPEPYVGLPQKPLMTVCHKCGTLDSSKVCRYCKEPKTKG